MTWMFIPRVLLLCRCSDDREMDSMSRLRHPNILMCMGVVVDARPIIVTELAERGALNTLLRMHRNDTAKLASTRVWHLPVTTKQILPSVFSSILHVRSDCDR